MVERDLPTVMYQQLDVFWLTVIGGKECDDQQIKSSAVQSIGPMLNFHKQLACLIESIGPTFEAAWSG